MNETGKLINDFIKLDGKSAPKITHALKHLGNGNMQNGIARIANYQLIEGKKIGTVRGAIGGVVIVGITFLIIKVIKDHKKHIVEGEAILKGLVDGMTDYENNESEDSTCGVVIVEAQEDDSSELPDNQKL